MAMNALATRGELLPAADTWRTMLDMAGELVKSGLLPRAIQSPAAALAIIQTGQELGLPPMYALRKIAVINGSPVVEAEVMLAMIYRDHGDNAVFFEETNEKRCVVRYKRKGWEKYQTFTWTIEEAKAAKLTGKDVWQMYPPAMLRARCISAMARAAFPDTVGGMYTHEEAGAEVDVKNGEIVVVERPVDLSSRKRSNGPTIIDPRVSEDDAAVIQAEAVAGWSQPRASTPARPVQTQPEPAPSPTRREVDEARYAELACLALDQKYPEPDKLKAVVASKLSDKILAGSIAKLEGWLLEQQRDAEEGPAF